MNSGNVSRSSWGAAAGTPTLIVYRLPETLAAERDPSALPPHAESGSTVFHASCAVCHGAAGAGGEGAKLAGLSSRYSQAETVHLIVDPRPGMPKPLIRAR